MSKPLTLSPFFAVPFLIIGCHQTPQTSERTNHVRYRQEVSQYGVTWTFDKPVRSGQFITGDWWVEGPVTIVSVTPAPGAVGHDEGKFKKNRYNDTSLKADTSMRNGSMVILEAGKHHGFDSRAAGYSEEHTVQFPFTLPPGRSLVSSISNTTLPLSLPREWVASCSFR